MVSMALGHLRANADCGQRGVVRTGMFWVLALVGRCLGRQAAGGMLIEARVEMNHKRLAPNCFDTEKISLIISV